MKNSVIIGCGQIGALYDFDNELCLTHAKGYSLSNKFNLKYVIDIDFHIAKKVSEKYNCDFLINYKELDLRDIDIISICVHTEKHFEVLNYLYLNKFDGFIILEKPVVSTDEELEKLKSYNKSFLDKIYVNYIRRFDTKYIDIIKGLKDKKFNEVESIQVNYFGDFEHNAVHALNIFNYIFDINPKVCYKDSTLLILSYAEVKVVFMQCRTQYLNYDISFFTKTHKIIFSKLGYHIDIYKSSLSKKFKKQNELTLEFTDEVLDGYIVSLLENILDNNELFPTVYEGIRDLEIIKEIKNVSNHTC